LLGCRTRGMPRRAMRRTVQVVTFDWIVPARTQPPLVAGACKDAAPRR
jgi:hypothetical protein